MYNKSVVFDAFVVIHTTKGTIVDSEFCNLDDSAICL